MNTLEETLAFLAPSETARAYLDRALREPLRSGIPFVDARDPEPALRAGEIVEIVGAPGSGKTEFVTEIAAHAVLPRARDGVRYDGSEVRVIVVDCDGKFDQLRLLRALNRKIEEKLANVRENQRVTMRDEVYEESMSRFTLVRAHGMVDALKTLTALDAAWSGAIESAKRDGLFVDAETAETRETGEDAEGRGANGAKSGEMAKFASQRLVICDNVAAFYWLDRASRKDHGAPFNIQRVFSAAARLFKRLASAHRAAVVVTKTTLSSNDGRRGGQYKDFLPVEWTNAVTQRVLLAPSNKRVGYGEYAGVATWDVPVRRHGGAYTVTEQGMRC